MAERTPERFVRELSEAIDAASVRSEGRVGLVQRKKRTVVEACGWHKSSRQRREILAELLDSQGIDHLPHLAESGIAPDTWLRFSKHPLDSDEPRKTFNKVATLEEFVQTHFEALFSDIPGLAGLTRPDDQAPITIDGRNRYMDLLFDDSDGGKVVVEFKKSDPTHGVVEQLRMYMDALRKTTDAPIRGVIITAKPRTETLQAQIGAAIDAHAADHPIDWFWYSVEVNLRLASAEDRVE